MALAGAVLAAAAAAPTAASAAGGRTGRNLGVAPLGVNTASWDGLYTGSTGQTIDGELRAAGLGLIRYPGGSWADEYDWNQNADFSQCVNGQATPQCQATDSLGFDAFSAEANAAGAGKFLTVNYGSGSPALAAAWVARARSQPGEQAALWEVGQESYGCFEVNEHLAGYPTYVSGYVPNGPVCPSTAVMAQSYAANSQPYFFAMHRADPTAKIGAMWAFDPREAIGSEVTDASAWNRTVLSADGSQLAFLDAHWYPFGSMQGVTDAQILASVGRIPAAAAKIRAALGTYAPRAGFVVGETNISNAATTQAFEPVSALYAAATDLEWLSQGAQSVDWWDMNNYGSPTTGDYGLFSSGSPEAAPAGAPLDAYYGELLASRLAQPGARVQSVPTGSPTVLGFRARGGGQVHTLLVNTDTSGPATVALRGLGVRGSTTTETYSAATASQSDPIQTGTTSGAALTLPTESIVTLDGR